MKAEPYGTTTFCDDIRQEVNGKFTLVGCYSADMSFNGPAPGRLPTFAAIVNLRIPMSVKFTKIRIRVILEDGEETSEIFALETEPDLSKLNQKIDKNTEANEKVTSITVPCRWSPFQMKENGYVKVRGYLDDGPEIKLGALRVIFSEKPKIDA